MTKIAEPPDGGPVENRTEEPRHHFHPEKPERPGSVRFGSSTPIFRVEDMRASLDYYRGQLGFQVAWDWGDPPSFACVKRGEVHLFLSEQSQGAGGTWLFIDVDDVDRLYEEYTSSGARIVQPPTDYPWGSREMRVDDLDGHRLRFASTPTGETSGRFRP